MKKKIIKRVGLFLIPLLVFVLTVFASVPSDTCSTQTIFWGESCCTYTSTSETGATILMTKCCKYVFWIVVSCETTYAGPI